VLVVDDNDGFRESLIALLVSGGIEVAGEASSGREALELVNEIRPDIVLMDVRMPHMDGVETTRRLKAEDPGIRVIAVTAQEDEATVREMLVAGASGYVTKNTEGDDILQAVTEAATGGAVLSPTVTPAVIDQLTDALASERKRSEELEEAHLALIERVGRRHELVARLGHELRTPVTVILGLAQTLASRELPANERDERSPSSSSGSRGPWTPPPASERTSSSWPGPLEASSRGFASMFRLRSRRGGRTPCSPGACSRSWWTTRAGSLHPRRRSR
jgi:DNA-binding NarL/FixJ family response regulator